MLRNHDFKIISGEKSNGNYVTLECRTFQREQQLKIGRMRRIRLVIADHVYILNQVRCIEGDIAELVG